MLLKLDVLGVPTRKLTQFETKGIMTVEDLAKYFPRRYLDFRKVTRIADARDGEVIAILGKIEEVRTYKTVISAKVSDDSGRSMYIKWFHMPYVAKMLTLNAVFIFCGKVQVDLTYKTKNMINPMYFSQDIIKYQRMMPVYSKIKGMADEYLQNCIKSALMTLSHKEFLEPSIINQFGLMKAAKAFHSIHQPKNEEELEQAKKRFLFDDLFQYAMQMQELESESIISSPFVMPKFIEAGKFLKTLSFELTDGQREALRAISVKMKLGKRVNAMIQGDVGCGKTIVAILLMLVAAENGFQSVLMAPTNVLALQHYEDLVEKMKGTPYKVGFISGEMKAKDKRKVLEDLKNREIHMVVGTHALLGRDVVIPNLALTIVDEEHRFGVIQRNQLKEKARLGVHSINMSATPIPRSLALAMWGDQLDVHTIKTLPMGRKPVKTVLLADEMRFYKGIYQQIQKGHQAYVVCPLIEDSDSELMAEVDSVETTFEKMKQHFSSKPEVKLSMISGKMKPEEVAAEIEKFSRNETNVLISTTIIEVGVNVPNATMIVIKNAERFGLSQLHQLRGRVGRGSFESYCVLLSEKEDNLKLKVMCESTDGFTIAKRDLELRGTGDFIGTKQSGQNKYVMLIMSNMDLYLKIKEEVKKIYQDPKRLSFYNYLNILNYSEGA
ncbi:ATP-dependent DNA helicase RecG (plasmid) [Paenibacillus thiaminolyticus]|uniref:ATP-dependent DNA helicase RecG n=1 Tax=Paenibacillus thiaminolyticus TaxID=49283 RepID=UPI00232B0560|nr:ATP-dependent DNA helicase RecG [Paenibacillus thiaminolyticus]WCF11465.1 ATP-dependent DNA helicase RecG [Paenibacillus thiaminolyticus]